MPHSWHWWMCSLVVPSCWAWVIGLKSSLMREMRTEGSFSSFFSPFFFFFSLLMSVVFMLFPALKRRNSTNPTITYLVFDFAGHPSCVWCPDYLQSLALILSSVWQLLLPGCQLPATTPIFGSHVAHVLMQNAYTLLLAVPWVLQNTYILLLVTPSLYIFGLKAD